MKTQNESLVNLNNNDSNHSLFALHMSGSSSPKLYTKKLTNKSQQMRTGIVENNKEISFQYIIKQMNKKIQLSKQSRNSLRKINNNNNYNNKNTINQNNNNNIDYNNNINQNNCC